MGPRPAVYVASPLGFFAAGRHYLEAVLLPTVRHAGFDALDPWDHPGDPIGAALAVKHPEERRTHLTAANAAVAARNARLIRDAAAVLAVLDGSDVDSGVAAEIGFAAALGTPVVGVRTDWRSSGDNEAATVNLQVEWFLESTGGTICPSLEEALAELARVLDRALDHEPD